VSRARSIDHAFRRKSSTRGGAVSERGLAELASAQHGVVSRAQLLSLGWGSGAIHHRVAAGRLVRRQHGVYSIGGAPRTRESQWMEALLACGGRAVLSHRTAGHLWDLLPRAPDRVEITAPGACRRPGIIAHRSRPADDELAVRFGFPVTTPARTLLDLAVALPPRRLERVIEEAEVQRRLDHGDLERLLARHAGRAGAGRLRRALGPVRLPEGEVVRSVFEAAFARFLADRGLPPPRLNASLTLLDRRVEVDCAWPARRVVVELDGHATHGTRSGFERDRDRDRALLVAGWSVVRITWRQFHTRRDRLERDLRALLCGPRVLDRPCNT